MLELVKVRRLLGFPCSLLDLNFTPLIVGFSLYGAGADQIIPERVSSLQERSAWHEVA